MSSALVEFVGGPACGSLTEMQNPSRFIYIPLPPKDMLSELRGDDVAVEWDEYGRLKRPPLRRAEYEFRNRGIDRYYYRFVGVCE